MTMHTTLIENNKVFVGAGLLIIIVLYVFSLNPLLNQNAQLQTEMEVEKELSIHLNQVKQQLSTLPAFAPLSSEQAKKHLNDAFKAINIKLNLSTISDNSATTNIPKIPFNQLLDALQRLKNQRGILVTSAKIKRIKPSVVSAHLTFYFP